MNTKSETRRLTEGIHVRVLPVEYEEIVAAAGRRDMTVPEFIRTAVRNELEVHE